MSIKEANKTLFDARKSFKDYIDYKQISVDELANYIGKTPSYVYQLLGGQANNRQAYVYVNKLFTYTNYDGENWLEL